MKMDKNETHSLKSVSNAILEMVGTENFVEKFIFDETAFHTLVLNKSLHEYVLRERLNDVMTF